MLSIERLRLQLPSGFEHRAANITRLLGDNLAESNFSDNIRLDRLSIESVKIDVHATDQEIAQNITKKITAKIRGSL
jgi:hypothetical protein